MYGPLLFGLLVAAAVMMGFWALWRYTRSQDPVEGRLEEYGVGAEALQGAGPEAQAKRGRLALPRASRLLAGLGLGQPLARLLARADLPLTAAEFALVMSGAGLVGFVVGTLRVGPALGLAVGVGCALLPLLYARIRAGRRLQAFTEQLPEVLTLLVGGLRAGYGLSQALEMLIENLPPPASTEFARVMRAVGLGLPIQQALAEMGERMGSDDFSLVVTAITAQYEMGGNLAQTLETIGETVQERLRLLREVRVMTAQQRLTGYVLAAWPIALGIGIYLINPDYMSRLFEPDMLWLPIAAVVLMLLGFLVIRRIVDIEV